MKLLEQRIEKNLELEEKLFVMKMYKKQVYKIVKAYNIAMAFKNLEIEKSKEKNRLWKRFFLAKSNMGSKKSIKVLESLSECMADTGRILSEIKKEILEGGYSYSDIYKNTAILSPIGIRAYEFPE